MEKRRGRRLAGLALLGFAAGAQGANGVCPMVPGERRFDFRVLEGRRSVELRRHGTPDTAAPACALRLACEVRRDPSGMSYTLRRGSILAGEISRVEFYFADGTSQACEVTEARAPR